MSSAAVPEEFDSIEYGGCTLRSAFQPIFSFSHRRLVGHEALLRPVDASGRPVPPPTLFQRCASVQELRDLDHACSLLHARGFARDVESPQWLFLNVDASAFSACGPRGAVAPLLDVVGKAGLLPSQTVIELLEAALPDGPEFEHWVEALKQQGFLIALDDFGAGHSNFDRVFRLRPHIVKLDRGVIARAATDTTVSRVMAQMISLLHECGAQVLIEGVETAEEAMIALDSDADFVQGYHFGRPQPALRRPGEHSVQMADVWARCDERSRLERQADARRVEPYAQALMQARVLLQAALPMHEACAAFIGLADADLCYLLDSEGIVVAQNVIQRQRPTRAVTCNQFAPLLDVRNARWSRRPYFRRALEAPGELQVTRPYPTMHSRRMSATLSVCFVLNGATLVLCGDLLWPSNDAQPGPPDAPAPPMLPGSKALPALPVAPAAVSAPGMASTATPIPTNGAAAGPWP